MHIQILLLKYFWKPLSLICSLFCTNGRARRMVRQKLLYSRSFPYPKVLSVAETVNLLQQGASLARLGDGEFNLALGKRLICYQKNSRELQRRMREILNNPNGKCLVGIPPCPTSPGFFREYFTRYPRILSMMQLESTYANANISRNNDFLVSGIKEYRKIWDNKIVVFIYSSAGRFAVAPELFSNIKKYYHIDVMPSDAFEQHDSIMAQAQKFPRDYLFLIACGPAATVLAYDLCTMGYWAIDIGHLPNCYANEVSGAPMPEKLPICKK